jgi:hypothetical protein
MIRVRDCAASHAVLTSAVAAMALACLCVMADPPPGRV